MWLLNAKSQRLEFFADEMDVYMKYAILSHTWTEDEVTFQEMMHSQKSLRTKKGHAKVQYACQQARKDRLDYMWIDTCCIDKTSSAELSEAINSMYRWYRNAKICYAYLSDVHEDCPCLDNFPLSKADLATGTGWASTFASSRWHTRSWTLQELIAPRVVRFYGVKWNFLGSKGSESEHTAPRSDKEYLRPLLSYTTNIDRMVLEDSSELSSISVAKKMMWASQRTATRIEDQAYSLFGIFKINMPLLYGEGWNAFLRLQQEIVRTTNDLSILAWLPRANPSDRLLAPRPQYFRRSGNVVRTTALIAPETSVVTDVGIRIKAAMIRKPLDETSTATWMILNCRYDDDLTGPMAVRVHFRDPIYKTPDFRLDENEYYEASLPLYNHSRLDVISIEECQDARMQGLLLVQDLRKLDQDTCINPLPRFWLKFATGPSPKFTIVDTDPNLDWNHDTGVLCPSSRDALETHVTVDTPSRKRILFQLLFSSSSEFWRPRHRVHQNSRGYKLVLAAVESDNRDLPGVTLSLPPSQDQLSSGQIVLSGGEIVAIDLERKEIMGTLVFVIAIGLVESTTALNTCPGRGYSSSSLTESTGTSQRFTVTESNDQSDPVTVS